MALKEMKQQAEVDSINIELRSEKIRNVIGQIPPTLLRRGIVVTSIVMILLITGICLIPYNETITVPVTISVSPNQADVYCGVAYISDKYVKTIKKGIKVKIELFGYPASEYGQIVGEISQVYSSLDEGTGIKANIFLTHGLKTSKGYTVEHMPSFEGNAYIIMTKQPILYKIFGD